MRKVYAIILIVFLSGCVVRSGGSGSSFDGLSSSYGGDAQVFADRTAQELGRRYTPAQNPLALHKAPGIFGDSLEQALRNRGFAVVSPDSGGASGLAVSYTVDTLEMDGVPAKGYVQITLADGRVFTFSRELEHGAVIPTNASPDVPMSMDENTSLPVPVQETELPVAQTSAPNPTQPIAAVPVAPLPSDTKTAPHTVHSSATATKIAKRNKVSVANFCQWNEVTPTQVLPTGYRVHLQQPAQVSTAKTTPFVPITQNVPVAPIVSSAATPTIAPVPPVVQSVSVPMPATVTPQSALLPPVQDIKHSDAKEEIPVAPLPDPASTWTITPGNLQAQVSAWSAQANYQLIWKTQNDFEMESHARFQGDFLDAIRQLFTGLQRSGHALRVTLYQANNVLEVSEE